MRFIYKLTIPFLFAFQNSYCQDTISIRLSVNETFQTIERMSSIKIFNGKESISNHFLNDSMVVIDNLTNNAGNVIGVELCVNSYFMKITNLPEYVFTNGKWSIDFDYFPFSSENEIEASADVDNSENVIVVLGYKSKKPNTEGMEFYIFQREKDVSCLKCNWFSKFKFWWLN